MATKQRIAVQASEYHHRDIQPYDFALAMISRDKFKLVCLFDETQTNVRNLQINSETHYLFAYEIEKDALRPGYKESLTMNWPLVSEQFKAQSSENGLLDTAN